MFLLNAEATIEVDLPAVNALDELRRILAERGIIFAMARVKTKLRDLLISGGFVETVRGAADLPDLADRNRRLPGLVRRPPRVDASGADPSAAVNPSQF